LLLALAVASFSCAVMWIVLTGDAMRPNDADVVSPALNPTPRIGYQLPDSTEYRKPIGIVDLPGLLGGK
jgi:hypothetical protein